MSGRLIDARRGRATVVSDGADEVAVLIPWADYLTYERLVREEEDRVDNAAADAARAESGERAPLSRVMADCGVARLPVAEAATDWEDVG